LSTPSTCASSGNPDERWPSLPAIKRMKRGFPFATSPANLIRLKIVPEFTHAPPRSGHPSGVCHENVGCPSCAINLAVVGVVSAGRSSARRTLMTS
jgi:hypothetical protein